MNEKKTAARAATRMSMGLGGLPVLGRGQHVGPEHGACFMEYASLLAGVGFSDHPRCTHPLLAHVARMVNDGLDDDNRRSIAPLVPDVISIRRPSAAITAAVVTELTSLALKYEPNTRRIARMHRRALHRTEAAGIRRRAVVLSEPLYRTGTATQAVALSLRTLASHGPSALREALEGSIAAARRVAQSVDASGSRSEAETTEVVVRTP